jgi:hypothetical protein
MIHGLPDRIGRGVVLVGVLLTACAEDRTWTLPVSTSGVTVVPTTPSKAGGRLTPLPSMCRPSIAVRLATNYGVTAVRGGCESPLYTAGGFLLQPCVP